MGFPQSSLDENTKDTDRQDQVSTCVQLLRTYSRFVHQMHQVFSRYGLTGPQFDVLATLHRDEGIMQQELAAQLRVTKGNVTGVVDRMVVLGWIERRPDPEDRRMNCLYLTDQGKEKFASVHPAHLAQIDKAMADFSPDDSQTLKQLLAKLEAGLEK